MSEPNEAPLPVLWQRMIEEVRKAQGSTSDGPYQAMQLYLDIEERAVRLAAVLIGNGVFPPTHNGVITGATTIARHLRVRMGLPENP